MRNSVAIFVLLSVAHPVGAVEKVVLHALFKDKAIVLVDGARRVMAVGDTSPEGVKLVSVDTRDEIAEIEVDGKRESVRLGAVMSGFMASGGRSSVTLYPDRSGHFLVEGSINGAPVRFLVDTGATSVALSSAMAGRIGIDYRRFGRIGAASTAGGIVRAYSLKLASVQVGDITLYNVDASVIEGSHPTEALLGMSFLGQLDMTRDSDKMELLQR